MATDCFLRGSGQSLGNSLRAYWEWWWNLYPWNGSWKLSYKKHGWPDQVLAIELQGEPQRSLPTNVSVTLWYVPKNAPLAKKIRIIILARVMWGVGTVPLPCIVQARTSLKCAIAKMSPLAKKRKACHSFVPKAESHTILASVMHKPMAGMLLKASTFPSFAWIKGRSSSALPRAWQGHVFLTICTLVVRLSLIWHILCF